MNILKYLPEKSEYALKFAEALKPYEAKTYVIGSSARKGLYGLKTTVNDYDFLISCGCNNPDLNKIVGEDLEKAFPGKVTSNANYITVDAESFTAKVRSEPVDQFLTSVRFAGDGLAVQVSNDRPVVIPEYMTLPPTTQIIACDVKSDQMNPEWEKRHIAVLEEFQKELFRVVQDSITSDEPTKS